jgi:hypothetical protein
MNRGEGLEEFYQILDLLRIKIGGFKFLADSHRRMGWPTRGVYFFFEAGEVREDEQTARVVRVGTHAVSRNSRATLWTRLRQHRGSLKGTYAGGGSERGSVFRYLVGDALLKSGCLPPQTLVDSWNAGQTASVETSRAEHALEVAVSDRIRVMPFLCVGIDDPPGSESIRKVIERNTIALLSNFQRVPIDRPSKSWLGLYSAQPKVRESGLWNVDHVDEDFTVSFLVEFRHGVDEM